MKEGIKVKKFLAVILMIFIAFIILINFNDQFYTGAQDKPVLSQISSILRFRDVFQPSDHKISQTQVKKDQKYKGSMKDGSFTREVKDIEHVQITQPVLDEHFLNYHKTIDGVPYFIETSLGEGVIDPKHKIWRLNNDRFEEVLNIEGLHMHNAMYDIVDFAIDGNDKYLSFHSDDNETSYIYRYNNEGLEQVYKGIYRYVYNANTGPFSVQKEGKIYFSTFDKNEKGYALNLQTFEKGKMTTTLMRQYGDDKDPHEVPIMMLIGKNEDYYVFKERYTNQRDWINHVKDLELKDSIVILNQDFEEVKRIEGEYWALIQDDFIIVYDDEDYRYLNKTLTKSEQFNSLESLFNWLKNEGVAVYSISNGGAFFDQLAVMAPTISYMPENYPDTVSKVDHYHIFFTDEDEVLIVDREYGKREVELIKLHLQ